ncbi:MAG: hypothetical protein Tsb0018_05550 [Opitutales bacterium]|tara:strand:+ start:174 stop:878 length:705 start_codon:yes stop_codon:yes gene_type:complete
MHLEILESRHLLAAGENTDHDDDFHFTSDNPTDGSATCIGDHCEDLGAIVLIGDNPQELDKNALTIHTSQDSTKENAPLRKKTLHFDYEEGLETLHKIDRTLLDGLLAGAQGTGYAFASALLLPVAIPGAIGYTAGKFIGFYTIEDYFCKYDDYACQAFIEDTTAFAGGLIGGGVGLGMAMMLPNYTVIGPLQYWKVISLFGATTNVAFEVRDVYFEKRDSLLTKMTNFMNRDG